MSTRTRRDSRIGWIRNAASTLPTRIVLLFSGLAFAAVSTHAECVLVRERQAPEYTPHISVHFGDPDAVPARVECATLLEKRSGYWCVPIYAWNLWDDARNVEFAIRTPIPPTGFDHGPQISGVQMHMTSDELGTISSFQLSAAQPLCGPALLGCLRLAAEELPASFEIGLVEHTLTHRKAIQSTSGSWRSFTVRGEGSVGSVSSCGEDACSINRPVTNLQLHNGSPGVVGMTWNAGSGNFTLLRYRTDGRYPTDPWDGELLAFLPASIQQFEKRLEYSGDIHVAAWSVSRGPEGRLEESSNIECGSVSSLTVHQPIAVEQMRWDQIKRLYR